MFAGTVTATNGVGDGVTPAASQNFSITIIQAPVAPAITDGPPPTTGTVGVAYSFTYTASGYPTPVFNVSSGALPGGLTLNPTTGLLSGSPTATGVFTGTVTATNGVGDGVTPAASQNFSITVSQVVAVPTNVALGKTVTVSSTESVSTPGSAAVDGSLSTRWSSLYSDPQWIDVDLGNFYDISEVDLTWETAAGKNYQIQTSTDNVNWTTQTTVTGNTKTGLLKYPYATPVTTVRYVRMYGTARVTGYGYSIYEFAVLGVPSVVVNQAPAITDGPPPTTGTTGTAYSFTYTASGFPAPVFNVSSGALPGGLTLNSATGLLSGSPTAAGVFTGTVTATNGVGDGVTPAASQNFSITVSQAPTPPANLALNMPVTVSSTESTSTPGSAAVDGNTTTRWSSLYSDPQWIEVDLGTYYDISEVDLTWEAACGKNYQIQTSSDNINWTAQTTVTGNTTTGEADLHLHHPGDDGPLCANVRHGPRNPIRLFAVRICRLRHSVDDDPAAAAGCFDERGSQQVCHGFVDPINGLRGRQRPWMVI